MTGIMFPFSLPQAEGAWPILRTNPVHEATARVGAIVRMSVPGESLIRWVLFCLKATAVPVLYFMFVFGGFLPLADDTLYGVMAGNIVIAVTSDTGANPEPGAR